jgi:hypothetical protein
MKNEIKSKALAILSDFYASEGDGWENLKGYLEFLADEDEENDTRKISEEVREAVLRLFDLIN